jgi:periplasmic protein TonB
VNPAETPGERELPDAEERRGAEVNVPAVVFNPAPVYPPELAARRIEGVVKVRVEVGDDGQVVKATVAQSSRYAAFDRAALDVVPRWRFTPTRDTPAAPRVLIVPIRFGIVE